jgi:hypothetical protein
MSRSLTVNTLSFTLAAATALKLLPLDPTRRLLLRENTGTNPVTFKFGSVAPASATDGVTLDAPSASGGQGGSILLSGDDVPVDALWAYSTAGTTVTVEVGTVYAFL